MNTLTPIKDIKIKNMPTKIAVDWPPGKVLENIHWFGLKNILERYSIQDANRIIHSIKKHWDLVG